MFTSISKALPSTNVTTQFTADAAGSLAIDASIKITVNGTTITARPVPFNAGDVVAATTVSSGSFLGYLFIPYSINGAASTFAVVTKSSDYPLLYDQYRNKYWNDFQETSHNVSFLNTASSTENTLTWGSASVALTDDAAGVLDPTTNSVYFISASGQVLQNIKLNSKPLSATLKVDSATGLYDFYVLTADGYITKIAKNGSLQRSTVSYPGAFALFADDSGMWLAGNGVVWQGFDMNSAAAINGLTQNFGYGVALNGVAYLSTRDGKFYRLTAAGNLKLLYTATYVGCPVVYGNNVVLPVPEEYALVTFDNSGAIIAHTDTAPYLPIYAATDGSQLVVSSANTTDVLVIAAGAQRQIVRSNSNVTFAIPIGANFVLSHYLADQVSTYIQQLGLTAPTLQAMTGPVSEIGTPPQVLTISGSNVVYAYAPPGVTLRVAGATPNAVKNGDALSVSFTPTAAGVYSQAIVLGDTAVDYSVTAVATTEHAVDLSIDVVSGVNPCVFQFTLAGLSSAPISLSYGSLKLNGSAYDGHTSVKAGDVITATFAADVPCAMLTIADTQFALPQGGPKKTVADTHLDVVLGDQTSVSSVTIATAGSYYLPSYSNAIAQVNGKLVTTQPMALKVGDVLSVLLERASNNWYDTRDTFVLGPVNYAFRTRTEPNTIPSFLDFGTLYDPFPSYSYNSDPLVIAGMTPGITSVLTPDNNTLLSVNGGAFQSTATVTNGDSLVAQVTIANFFTSDTHVTASRKSTGVQTVGQWHIIPVQLAGAYHVPESIDTEVAVSWTENKPHVEHGASGNYAWAKYSPRTAAPADTSLASRYMPRTYAPTDKAPAQFESRSALRFMSAPDASKYAPRTHAERVASTAAFESVFAHVEDAVLLAAQGSYAVRYVDTSWKRNALAPYLLVDQVFVYMHPLYYNYAYTPAVEQTNYHQADLVTLDAEQYQQHEFYVDRAWLFESSYGYLIALNLPVPEPHLPQTYATFSHDVEWSQSSAIKVLRVWQAVHETVGPMYPVDVAFFNLTATSSGAKASTEAAFAPSFNEHKFALMADAYSGVDWVQQPSMLYGAFADDTSAALDGAMRFKDYQIVPYMQQPENMHSYRVVFDYALHCAIPQTGLYPVAWLLGGG